MFNDFTNEYESKIVSLTRVNLFVKGCIAILFRGIKRWLRADCLSVALYKIYLKTCLLNFLSIEMRQIAMNAVDLVEGVEVKSGCLRSDQKVLGS